MSSEDASQDSSSVQRRRELIEAARRQVEKAQGPWGAGPGSPIKNNATLAPSDDGSDGSSLPPPDSFAGYKILREIHRGAQGVVYQAVQESMSRKVAIKVMKEGPFAGPSDRARFDREVRLLGQLNHPNIVTIHGTGEAAGCHYFVMDYISGHPLDVYMASEERSIDDTLRLFFKICDAVESAHLRGIIHRDLKPSNIRVDARGEPYVLDFGLAKSAGDTGASLTTMTGRFLGTPAWASPEQAEGVSSNIDIRSDVYSLGVVLFQMLTGKFPYKVTGSTFDVLERIRKVEPLRPRELRRKINDEVETIVLKCLSKERRRRYQSAGELARDVQRYLSGDPIEAKRDSLSYVFRKQLRKYKPQATIAASFFLLLAIGFFVVLGYWQKADASDQLSRIDAKRARIAFDFVRMIIEQADPMRAKKADLTVRAVFDQAGALIDVELAEEPEVRADVHDLVGNVYRHLGLREEAKRHIESALALREGLYGSDHPDVALSKNSMALVIGTTDLKEAEKLLREALEIQSSRLGEETLDKAKTMSNLGQVLIWSEKPREAEPLFRESLAIRRQKSPGDNQTLGTGLLGLASLMRRLEQFEESEALYEEAIPLYRRVVGENHPRFAIALNGLAVLLDGLDRTEEAVPLFRQSLEIRRKHLGEGHKKVALARESLAVTLQRTGHLEESAEVFEQALKTNEDSVSLKNRATLRRMHRFADLLREMGELERAEDLCRAALASSETNANVGTVQKANALRVLGHILLDEGRPADAEQSLRQALDLDKDNSNTPSVISIAKTESLLGAALDAEGRCADAEALLTSAYRKLIEAKGSRQADIERVRQRLVDHFEACGQPERAEALRAKAEDEK